MWDGGWRDQTVRDWTVKRRQGGDRPRDQLQTGTESRDVRESQNPRGVQTILGKRRHSVHLFLDSVTEDKPKTRVTVELEEREENYYRG